MGATLRQYCREADYEPVGRFLVRTYRWSGGHVNWLPPRWEYMHYHPYIRRVDLSLIGIWEANGEIVAVVHPEDGLGTVYFEIHPAWDALKEDMLTYAQERLSASANGSRRLRAVIHDRDEEFREVASRMGYAPGSAYEVHSWLEIPSPFPPIFLPAGFRLKSLADDNDLRKVDRVLWRGFGHGEEPPEDGIRDRELMQSAPNFRKDLNIVVEAPDGNFVSYCGMWYEPVHRLAMVEPVATDPLYRRLGLGSAAVLEGVRRCAELGATEAWVGSAQQFYLSLGFRPAYRSTMWEREWLEGAPGAAMG